MVWALSLAFLNSGRVSGFGILVIMGYEFKVLNSVVLFCLIEDVCLRSRMKVFINVVAPKISSHKLQGYASSSVHSSDFWKRFSGRVEKVYGLYSGLGFTVAWCRLQG